MDQGIIRGRIAPTNVKCEIYSLYFHICEGFGNRLTVKYSNVFSRLWSSFAASCRQTCISVKLLAKQHTVNVSALIKGIAHS